MKKIFALAALMICFNMANAQFSAGARTGLSCWKSVYLGNSDNKIANKGEAPVWDKQVYVRYQTQKKLAFEVSVGHYNMDERYFSSVRLYSNEYDLYLPSRTLSYDENNNFVEFSLSAQYDISCPAMKKLKSYLGIVLSPTVGTYKSSSTVETNGVINAYNSKSTSWYLTGGLQHYMQYELTENLNLNSLAQFKINPATFFSSQPFPMQYAPNTRFSWQLGVGYDL